MTLPTSTSHQQWSDVRSAAVVIARDDIDTDQIIPARFLTTTTRHGLGIHCFADWRYDAAGNARPEFALNSPAATSRSVLVAGHNFGCGSSREHAPWSLRDSGFRVIVAGSFADIFRENAHKNGLLTVSIGDDISALQQWLTVTPDDAICVSLETQTLQCGERTYAFHIDAFSKVALLQGLDELAMLLTDVPFIEEWEVRTGRGR